MKDYEVPIIWESCKTYRVKAETLEEACVLALRTFLSEPDENYLEDSFSIDEMVLDENPNEIYDYQKVLNAL